MYHMLKLSSTHIISEGNNLLVYGYCSFQYGHWPNSTPTPSYSSYMALGNSVLRKGCTTTDYWILYLLRLYLLLQKFWCTWTETLKTTYHAMAQIRNEWLELEPHFFIIYYLVVYGDIFICSSKFVKLTMRFNYYPGKIFMNNSSHVIFLAIGDPLQKIHQILFSIVIGEMEQISVLFLTHISSTSFGDIPPLNHTISIILNQRDMAEVIKVAEVAAEVVEAVVVTHVADMLAEVAETLIVIHQFAMEMVPLLVSF